MRVRASVCGVCECARAVVACVYVCGGQVTTRCWGQVTTMLVVTVTTMPGDHDAGGHRDHDAMTTMMVVR